MGIVEYKVRNKYPQSLCFDYRRITRPAAQKTPKTRRSTTTMVAPTGEEKKMEIIIPSEELTTAMTAEHMTTCLKVWKTRIADKAGKIIKADVSSAPTRFIASTMMTAVITAIKRLYADAFTPVARAKFSSKVTAKILL